MEKLKVSIGKTYNLGNYESLRLDVGLEVDESPQALESTFIDVYGRVKGMLNILEEKNHIALTRRT